MLEPMANANTKYALDKYASTNAPDDTPGTVTRFYGNLDYALDVVANKSVTFVNIEELNDPFDPYMEFETSFHGNFFEFINQVSVSNPEHLETLRHGVTQENFESAIQDVKEKMSEKRSKTFILSTSGVSQDSDPRDSLYMWAHYANGHRGIALEFDSYALATSILNHQQDLGKVDYDPAQVWIKVDYRDSLQPFSAEDYYKFIMQEIDPVDDAEWALAQHLELICRVKSTVWRTENEWRLMWESDNRMKFYRCPISETAVTGVIFGLLVGEQYQKDLLFELTRNFPGARAWKAGKRYGDFALNFTPL